MPVNLSVPKFDISAGSDLKEALRAAGLTNLFEPFGNDFTPSITRINVEVYLDSIQQDTRLKLDEKSVEAASYIELNFGATVGPPASESINFVFDRPFASAVTHGQFPLFVGVVNAP